MAPRPHQSAESTLTPGFISSECVMYCMYNEILVPTDDSEASRAAIDHAVQLASLCNGRVHGLFVVDSGPIENVGGVYPQAVDEIEEMGYDAVEQVEKAGEEENVETTTAVVTGVAHEEINDYIDEGDIDVVVMGTHGRQGVDRYLLGSVTERIVRTANAPVLTVRSGD